MSDEVVCELEVYKLLAQLGIDLGAGAIPRYGLMSAAVSRAFALGQSPECIATEAADPEIGLAPALCGVLSARKH
jgi:hypothetical protein